MGIGHSAVDSRAGVRLTGAPQVLQADSPAGVIQPAGLSASRSSSGADVLPLSPAL